MTIAVGICASGVYAADAKAGEAAYEKSCKSCHGPDGTPNPAVAKMMKVEMKDLKSAEVQSMSNATLREKYAPLVTRDKIIDYNPTPVPALFRKTSYGT